MIQLLIVLVGTTRGNPNWALPDGSKFEGKYEVKPRQAVFV